MQSATFWFILIVMEYTSIYRRFRPTTFDDVIGQNHIVRTLTNIIKSGKIGHAYLFTGTRGTGKTSCAKIFARAVNCLSPKNGSPCGECEVCKKLAESSGVDIIEIDAASNNGVDEIRTLKENVMYRPSIGKYKVYIIDEVHMLSASAFNALLKTLEEPPEHIVFILATTEVQKLPQTILSRCIRFDFRLIETEELIKLLKRIYGELGVGYDERALVKIAVCGEGSVRDTLSVADMCMSYCGDYIGYEDALEVLCATDFSTLDSLAGAILDGNVGKSLDESDRLLRMGRVTLGRDLANYYNELITVKNVPNYKPKTMTKEEFEALKNRADKYSTYRISRVMEIMAGMENQLRFASQPRILMEANIIKSCELITETSADGMAGRIRDLEAQLDYLKKNGVTVSSVSTSVSAENPTRPPVKDSVNVAVERTAAGEEKKTEELVFSESEINESANAEAKEIWSRVQEKLSLSNEMMLRMMCEGINSGMTISAGEFVLTVGDNATYENMNRPQANKTMNELIAEETNGKLKFVCRKKEEKGVSPQSRIALNDLFNGQIRFKK